MYAKVFSQIFDSSIADDYELRHFFMDLLVLADSDGVVDMTETSIAARTRIPVGKVKNHLVTLCDADERSRTKTDNGRRLKLIDDHRDWGWLIINYDKFRDIASDLQRREKTRLRTKKYRENLRCDASVTHGDIPVTPLSVSVDASGESVSGEKSPEKRGEPVLLPHAEIRTRVNALMKRGQDDRWANDEEHLLIEVSKRPRCLEEMGIIETFWKTGTYRPQKTNTLLAEWTGTLDRARNHDETNKRNSATRVSGGTGTLNEGRASAYAGAAKRTQERAAERFQNAGGAGVGGDDPSGGTLPGGNPNGTPA